MPLLLVLYFLLFLFLCLKNLKWGVYVIALTLPSYLIRFQVLGLPTTLLEGEILLLFLVFIIKTLKHSPRWSFGEAGKNIKTRIDNFKFQISNFKLLTAGCFLLIVAATVSMFISPNFRAAAGLWKAYFVEPILFFIVFIKTIKKEDLKFVFLSLCFSVFVLSVLAVYQKFTGVLIANPFWAAVATRRVTSVFPYPNALALYLAPIVTIAFGLLILKAQEFKSIRLRNDLTTTAPLLQKEGRLATHSSYIFPSYGGVRGGWVKVNYIYLFFYFLVSFLGLLAIYFTRSKGALIAILVGLIFYAFFYRGYRKIFIGILVYVFMFLCFYVFVSGGLPNLSGNVTVVGGDSISTRLAMWRETWQMLKTRPVLGAGLNSYQTALAPFHQKQYIEIFLYPHNIFLTFWSETGIAGLVAFILIIVWFYNPLAFPFNLRGRWWGLQVAVMAAMTTLLVHGLVDVPYFKNDLAVLFWIIVGMMVVAGKEQNHKTQ